MKYLLFLACCVSILGGCKKDEKETAVASKHTLSYQVYSMNRAGTEAGDTVSLRINYVDGSGKEVAKTLSGVDSWVSDTMAVDEKTDSVYISAAIRFPNTPDKQSYLFVQVLVDGKVQAYNIGSFIVADVVAAKYKIN